MENFNKPQIRFKGFDTPFIKNNLSNEVDFYSGLTYSPFDIVKSNGTFVIRSSNIKDGKLVHADNVYVNTSKVNCEFVKLNDIAVVVRNGSRDLIGKHAMVKKNTDNTVVGAFMTGIRSEVPFFINALLDSVHFKKEINKNLGATINQITTGNFKEMKFWFPDNIEEKNQIGNFFANLDRLINEHKQKHEKLRILKKSMLGKMFPKKGQDIPEIRFKGFSGDWKESELGKIGDPYSGLSGKSKIDFGHGEGRYVTYMNVFSNPISDINLIEKIEIDLVQNEVNSGDVLFTISSETADEVGMSSVWIGDLKNVYLNSFCFGYRPKIKIDHYFLANILRTQTFRKKMTFLAQGISRYNISKNKVMNLSISLPSYEEQIVIGTYFKNLDALIDQHKKQLNKLSNLKEAFLAKMFI